MADEFKGDWDDFDIVTKAGKLFHLGTFTVKPEKPPTGGTGGKPEKADFILTHTPLTGPAKDFDGFRLSKGGKHSITFIIEHEGFKMFFSGTLDLITKPRFIFGSYFAKPIIHTAVSAAKSRKPSKQSTAFAFDPGDTGTWGGSQGT